jgi:hypothetical protein
MNRVKLSFAVIFLLSPILINSQDLAVGINLGVAKARMNDLKGLNEDILKYLPFDAKQVTAFPLALNYGFSFSSTFAKGVIIGFEYGYFSTGSRISSVDYSGNYKYDNISSYHGIGIILGGDLIKRQSISLNLLMNFGCHFSNLKMHESLKVYEEEIESDYKFISRSAFIKPTVQILYAFQHFKFGVYMGYNMDMNDKFYLKYDQHRKLINPYDEATVKSDWNGIQCGIHFSVSILSDRKQ